MPLTDIQVRNAKASAAPYKLTDGNGMFLLVLPNGAKYWRLSYRFLGKQKTLALGVYPAVTLATARKKRDEAREQIAAGVDPSEAKKGAKRAAEIAAANSFEAVAREWYDSQRPGWSDSYAENVLNSLEVDVFPKIGPRPIAEIDSPQMLSIVREVEARGVRETAKRILQRSRTVFQYGIMTGRCSRNPAADIDAQTVLKKGPGVQHMARVKTTEIPLLMRDILGDERPRLQSDRLLIRQTSTPLPFKIGSEKTIRHFRQSAQFRRLELKLLRDHLFNVGPTSKTSKNGIIQDKSLKSLPSFTGRDRLVYQMHHA